MARLGLVCLILTGILVVQTMADDKPEVNPNEVVVERVADQPVASSPVESSSGESREAEAPEIRRLGKHHSSDKSVAGGGVIIGGLVTAIFAAVFCYIRVTRKRDGQNCGH